MVDEVSEAVSLGFWMVAVHLVRIHEALQSNENLSEMCLVSGSRGGEVVKELSLALAALVLSGCTDSKESVMENRSGIAIACEYSCREHGGWNHWDRIADLCVCEDQSRVYPIAAEEPKP